jgi:hypothetical protein
VTGPRWSPDPRRREIGAPNPEPRFPGHRPGADWLLVRREAVSGVGGFEDRFHGLFEDQAFFAKVLIDHDVFSTPDCLALYRQQPDSCCARAGLAGPVLAARHSEYLHWLSGYARAHPRRSLFLRFLARDRWLQRYGRLREARIRRGTGADRRGDGWSCAPTRWRVS